MWILAFSVSFGLLACSSRDGEWGLLEVAPFSGSAPRLTNMGMELPIGGAVCLDATCSERMKRMVPEFWQLLILVIAISQVKSSFSQRGFCKNFVSFFLKILAAFWAFLILLPSLLSKVTMVTGKYLLVQNVKQLKTAQRNDMADYLALT